MSELDASAAPAVARPERRWPLWVFFAALAARLTLLLQHFASPHFGVLGSDMRFYQSWAIRILRGAWTDHHAFYGLPGYAYLLAGIYKVCGVHPFAVTLLQAVVEATTTTLIFCLTRLTVQTDKSRTASPKDERLALIAGGAAAAGWVCCIPAQAYAVTLMPTSWLVAAFWFCVWAIVRQRNGGAVWPWAGLGLLVGMMAMMVATVLFLAPLLIAAIVVQVGSGEPTATRWPRRLAAIGVLLIGVLAGASPAWIHNCFVAKEPVFLSAHGGVNFWIGNWPGANGYPTFPPEFRSGQQELLDDSIRLAEKAAGHPLTRPEVSRYWSSKASAQIKEHPGPWFLLLGLKLRAFWSAFVYDDVTIIAVLREEGVLWPGLGFGAIAAVGLTGLGLGLVRGGPGRWIAAAVLLHMLALMPVFVTERYRLAAIPGLLILAASALGFLWTKVRDRRWVTATLVVCSIAVSTAFVFVPNHPPNLESMEAYNLALGELDVAQKLAPSAEGREQLDLAQRHLEIARRTAPNNTALLFAFGRYWTLKGDRNQAKAFYQKTIREDPHYSDALTNLGIMAMEEKQWAAAATLFVRAAAENPKDAGAQYLVARARQQLNDLPGALAAIEAALRLSPGTPPFVALRQQLLQQQSAPPPSNLQTP